MKIITALIFLILTSIVFAEDNLNEVVEKFDDWKLVCFKQGNKEQCEINHIAIIQNTELELRVVYQVVKQEELDELIEIFSIITPLGVNLRLNTALTFPDENRQINLSFMQCEVYGCVLSLNNQSQNKDDLKIFNFLKEMLITKNQFSIFIDIFTEEPLEIKSSLIGFGQSLKQLKKKI